VFDAEDRAGLDRLAEMPGVLSYQRDGANASAILDDLKRVPDLVAALTAAGVRITRVTPHEPSLEELYMKVRAR
jgi:hypothetical protein